MLRRPLLSALVAATVLIAGIVPVAHALSFKPSETEWATWPDYCRARYVVSGAGRNSEFVRRVSPSTVRAYEKQMGERVWHWLHHYCAGLSFLERAKKAKTGQIREHNFREAKGQMMGQYTRVPRSDPFFGQVATSLARVARERGDPEEALSFIEESVKHQPTFPGAYALGSLIYRDLGRMDEARELLLQGNSACDGSSAEIHYFLGLLYLEENDIDSAVVHAKQAYALGYPLPGLMARLNRLGRTLED